MERGSGGRGWDGCVWEGGGVVRKGALRDKGERRRGKTGCVQRIWTRALTLTLTPRLRLHQSPGLRGRQRTSVVVCICILLPLT